MQAIEIRNTSDREALITYLWEMGTVGLVENDDNLEVFFPNSVDISELMEAYTCRILEQTIENSFQAPNPLIRDLDPIFAGSRFFIVPSSSRLSPPSGWQRIDIDAQNAFGSGSHESTQLMIQALEEHLRPSSKVIDVGSGSGVLSAVAQYLGARDVFACDTHLDSALLTRRHASHAHVFAGSVDAVTSTGVDLVVANISARVIDTLSGELNRIAKPDGWLILSGFIADRPPQFFQPTFETGINEWRCWVCRSQDLSRGITASCPTVLQPFAQEWW